MTGSVLAVKGTPQEIKTSPSRIVELSFIVKPNPRKKATFKHFQQAEPKRWRVSTAMWSSRETRECLNIVFNYSGSAWKHVVDLWESGLHASIANEVIAGGSQPLMPEHLRKKLVTGWKDSRFI